MYLHLHKLCIGLHSRDSVINQQWQWLFAGWLTASSQSGNKTAALNLELNLVAALPDLPTKPPFFSDTHQLPGKVGILSVYQEEDDVVFLHYLDGACVRVPLGKGSTASVTGVLTQAALTYGRFEDITFTSLAPLLRRQGYYLLHAFAAGKDGRCVLIVGPSGSGKTTSGLSLLLAGWQLLANDILLLEERPDGVYALPTPGGVTIRAQTFTLLPELRRLISERAAVAEAGGRGLRDSTQDVSLTAQQLVNGRWGEPQRVTAVYFPYISGSAQSTITRQNGAVCLARLMTESVDRWDKAMITDHMNLLQTLSRQAKPYDLYLGQNMVQLPRLLEL